MPTSRYFLLLGTVLFGAAATVSVALLFGAMAGLTLSGLLVLALVLRVLLWRD